MAALYIIAGIIIFFAVLLSFNVSLRVICSYGKESGNIINIYAKIGFIKIHIIPLKQKKAKKPGRFSLFKLFKKKEKKPGKIKKKRKEKPKKEEAVKEKKKPNIPALIGLAKDMAVMVWKKLEKYLKIAIYRINLNIASDDACKTAMLYGTAMQSAYYLYEFLNSSFNVLQKKKDNIKIMPDFSKESMSFDIDVKIYIRLSHIFNIALSSAVCYLKFRAKSSDVSKTTVSDKTD